MSSCSDGGFDRQRQLVYFSRSLRQLPSGYCKLDTNRLTLVHFCVHALDLLGVWDDEELQKQLQLDKQDIIEWIYSLQVIVAPSDRPQYENHVGFKGGTFLGGSSSAGRESTAPPSEYNHGHIAMTYTALCTLTTLGDDWSRVDRTGIVKAMRSLQQSAGDGSFHCIAVGSEHDMRFLYCACAIAHMLDDWSGVDVDRAVEYIRSCRSFDGAIALLPGQEGHGGSTFCGVASLVLMDKLDEVMDNDAWRKDMIRWCVHRQVGGMQGRPNKAEDTCYSYWIGGTLRLLGHGELLEHNRLRGFVMQCQSDMGGFSKVIGSFPDILHSFYSMAYLSLSEPYYENKDNETQLKALNCTLGICQRRAACFEPVFP